MSLESVILGYSPIFFLRFQETSGTTAVDDSGNGRDFTLIGTASFGAAGWVPSDPASGAAQVDGGAGSGFIRNPITGLGGLTSFGIFLALDGNTGRQTALSTWLSYATATGVGDIRIGLTAAGSIQIIVKNATAITSALRPWRGRSILYIGWSNAAGTTVLYQDGILVAQGTAGAGGTMGNNGSFVIGQRQSAVGGSFSEPGHFLIDEIAFFGSNLAQDVVERISIVYAQTDATDPALESAQCAETNKVRLFYSKPVWGISTVGNYAITGGVTVLTATPDPSLDSVLLTTSGMTAGASYTVTASGIADADSGNALTSTTADFVAHQIGGAVYDEPVRVGRVLDYDVRVIQPIPVVQYLMRAYKFGDSTYVYWLVDNEPDFTAALAPVAAILLNDIVVSQTLYPNFCD